MARAHLDGNLAHGGGEVVGGVGDSRVGAKTGNNLDKRHNGHRVEKVHTNNLGSVRKENKVERLLVRRLCAYSVTQCTRAPSVLRVLVYLILARRGTSDLCQGNG